MCLHHLLIFFGSLIVVHAQHEIVYNFLNLNRENLGISKACDQDLQMISAGIETNEIWALKIVDASGLPESDFLWGNSYWMGSRKSCEFIQDPPLFYLSLHDHRNLTTVSTPMSVEYRVFFIRHKSKFQIVLANVGSDILHIGLCFPLSCNDEDSYILGEKVFKNASWSKKLLTNELEVLSTKNVSLREGFSEQPFIILLIIICSVFLMFTIDELIHNLLSQKDKKPNTENNEQPMKEISLREKYTSYFSIKENTKALFNTENEKNVFPILLGIRAMSFIWTVSAHMDIFGYSATDNVPAVSSHITHWELQWIASSYYAVDTFFFISSFLMSFSFFESQKKTSSEYSIRHFFKSLYNRYIRLTPISVLVLIIAGALSTFLNDFSSFWQVQDNERNCKLYWWRNLLYIQNFWPMSDMCMSWSYSLALDFQLYIVGCLLHLVYLKNKKLCVGLTVFLVVTCAIISGSLGFLINFSFTYDGHYTAIDILYTKPYTRIGVYLMGFWTAWYLSKISSTWEMSRKTILSFWTIAFSIMTILIYLPQYGQRPGSNIGVFFQAFGRPLWGVAMGIMFVICFTGNGGMIAKFLSAKIWYPLGRISYSCYLINPMVFLFILNASEKALHLEFHSFSIILLGFLSATYILAFAFGIFFETPIGHIISKFKR